MSENNSVNKVFKKTDRNTTKFDTFNVNTSNDYSSPPKISHNTKIIIAIAVTLFFGLIGLIIYYYILNINDTSETSLRIDKEYVNSTNTTNTSSTITGNRIDKEYVNSTNTQTTQSDTNVPEENINLNDLDAVLNAANINKV